MLQVFYRIWEDGIEMDGPRFAARKVGSRFARNLTKILKKISGKYLI